MKSQEAGAITMVSELIDNGRWKYELINEIFSLWEVQQFHKVILPAYPCDDAWSWSANKSGPLIST